MTVKEDLHALIDGLSEADAVDALDYLRVLATPQTSRHQALIEEAERAFAEAERAGAVLIPQEAVLTWVRTWGTPGEHAAEQVLADLEDRLVREAHENEADDDEDDSAE